MFRGLINKTKAAVASVVLKYVARASVAIPFAIAVGFALAATTVMLVDRYGQVSAYWVMAGALAAPGLLAALFVSAQEQAEKAKDAQTAAQDTSNAVSEVAMLPHKPLVGARVSASRVCPGAILPLPLLPMSASADP